MQSSDAQRGWSSRPLGLVALVVAAVPTWQGSRAAPEPHRARIVATSPRAAHPSDGGSMSTAALSTPLPFSL